MRHLVRVLPPRPLTIAGRRRKVLAAVKQLVDASPAWPLERQGQGELGEAIALLDYVLRQLNERHP